MKYTVDYIQEGQVPDFNKLVLMSKSPRRRDFLKDFNPSLEAVEIDELDIQETYMDLFKMDDFLSRAGKTCCRIAMAKSGQDEEDGKIYISSDTMVVCGNEIFNKPKTHEEAETMIRSYFGRVHHVLSSVCLRSKGYLEVFYSQAAIKFVEYYPGLEESIRAYVSSENPMDKAGAYGIQEISPFWVQYIEGDINTIIGLPVAEIGKRLGKMGL